MNQKHTPLPWHVEKHQRYIPYEPGGPGATTEQIGSWFDTIVHEPESDPRLRTFVAELPISTESSANSELIVRAVNNHARLERQNAELRAALKAAIPVLEADVAAIRRQWPDTYSDSIEYLALNQARAAIANAGGDK